MTACKIAEVLGIKTVVIESSLSEFLEKFMFENGDPIKEGLELKTMAFEDFRLKYKIPESVEIDLTQDTYWT